MHLSPFLLATLGFASALAVPDPTVKRDDYTTCLNDCVRSYHECNKAGMISSDYLFLEVVACGTENNYCQTQCQIPAVEQKIIVIGEGKVGNLEILPDRT